MGAIVSVWGAYKSFNDLTNQANTPELAGYNNQIPQELDVTAHALEDYELRSRVDVSTSNKQTTKTLFDTNYQRV